MSKRRRSAKHKNPALTQATRLAARYLAEDMIAELHPQRAVVKAIQERFTVSEQVGQDVYRQAWALLAEAEQVDRATRRGKLEVTLESLYRKALIARQFGVCARIAKQLADLFGVNAPIKVEGLGQALGSDEANRTDAELEYHLQHGYYPDEAPRARQAGDTQQDPLAALH